MVQPLEIPLDQIEEGPIKDSFEILRRWTEDLSRELLDGTFAQFGLKIKLFEGTMETSSFRYFESPNKGTIVSVFGLTQRADFSDERWIPMKVESATGSRAFIQYSNANDYTTALNNVSATDRVNFRLMIIYKG